MKDRVVLVVLIISFISFDRSRASFETELTLDNSWSSCAWSINNHSKAFILLSAAAQLNEVIRALSAFLSSYLCPSRSRRATLLSTIRLYPSLLIQSRPAGQRTYLGQLVGFAHSDSAWYPVKVYILIFHVPAMDLSRSRLCLGWGCILCP